MSFGELERFNNGDKKTIPKVIISIKKISLDIDEENYIFDQLKYNYTKNSGNLSISQITHNSIFPYFTPISLHSDLVSEKDDIQINSNIKFVNKNVEFSSTIEYDNEKKVSRFFIDFPRIELGAGGLSLKDLSPFTQKYIKNLKGALSLSGQYLDSNEADYTDLKIVFGNIEFQYEDSLIEGVNGEVHIDNLDPISTSSFQKITVKKLTNPLPLTDGTIIFELNKDRDLKISRSSWRWNKAEIRIEDSLISLDRLENSKLNLIAKNLAINDISPLSNEELDVHGNINGRITLGFKNNQPHIYSGYLVTTKNGVIKYTPKDYEAIASNQATKLLLETSA